MFEPTPAASLAMRKQAPEIPSENADLGSIVESRPAAAASGAPAAAGIGMLTCFRGWRPTTYAIGASATAGRVALSSRRNPAREGSPEREGRIG